MLLNIVFTFLQTLLFSVCHFGSCIEAMVLESTCMSNVLKSWNARAEVCDLIAQENGYEGKSAHKDFISGLRVLQIAIFTRFQESYVIYSWEKITANRVHYRFSVCEMSFLVCFGGAWLLFYTLPFIPCLTILLLLFHNQGVTWPKLTTRLSSLICGPVVCIYQI